MVNKKSPWYMENEPEIKVEVVKNEDFITYIFHNENEKDYFLDQFRELDSEYPTLNDITSLTTLLNSPKKRKLTTSENYILMYDKKIDQLEIDENVPCGYFRMKIKKKNNFIEISFREKNALLLEKSKVL